MALLYRDGEGVEQNDKKAVELFEKAASMKEENSIYSLGWMYEQGRGVVKDKEAVIVGVANRVAKTRIMKRTKCD